MEYLLALILAGLAALLPAVLRSSRPHPRHEFVFQMLAWMALGSVARRGAAAEPRAPADQHAA